MGNSSMSANLESAIRANADLHDVFELDLPNASGGTTTYRFSGVGDPVASNTRGQYKARVKTWGEAEISLGFPSFGLVTPSVTIVLEDPERELQAIHGGPAKGRVKGSAARWRLVSNSVLAADHYLLMDGIVKSHGRPSPGTFSYTVGPDDTALRKNLLGISRIGDDHRRAPDSVAELPGRFILGNWLSAAVPNARGMVEAVLIDQDAGIWYVSLGTMTSIQSVWVKASGADEATEDTSNWTALGVKLGAPYIRNGKTFCVLQDDASTKRTIDDQVFCDVVGPEKNWNGSGGSLFQDEPGLSMADVLNNFAWNRYPRGALPLSPGYVKFDETGSPDGNAAPVDTAAFTACDTVFGYMGWTTSMIITGAATGVDVLEAWARSFSTPIGYNDQFKLTAHAIDLGKRDVPSDFTRFDRDETAGRMSGPHTYQDTELTEQTVSYIRNSSRQEFAKTIVIADAGAPRRAQQPFEFTYGPAEAVT